MFTTIHGVSVISPWSHVDVVLLPMRGRFLFCRHAEISNSSSVLLSITKQYNALEIVDICFVYFYLDASNFLPFALAF